MECKVFTGCHLDWILDSLLCSAKAEANKETMLVFGEFHLLSRTMNHVAN